MVPAVSGCGTYIALETGTDLQVHTLLPPSLYHSYSLDRCFSVHRQNCNYSPQKSPVTLHRLEWETPTEDKCGKLAAFASDGTLSLVLIFDVSEKWPLVIEVDHDGVSALQWISGTAKEGTYTNCSQLAVFMNFGTQLRVYSLDCTLMLFTVPKPVFDSIILRPGDSNIWSVVAEPYYEKNLAARSILTDPTRRLPTLLHFHNSGSTSNLLASLTLDFMPSASSKFTWSPSGKWLLYFDDLDSLFGYSLKIFNLLGIHSRPIKSVKEHQAQATLEYSEMSDAFVTGWMSTWGCIEDIEYVATVAEKAYTFIHVKAYAVSEGSATRKVAIDVTEGVNWTLITDSSRSVSYQIHNGPLKPAGTWRTFMCLGQKLLLATDNLVAVILVKVATPLLFEIEYTVSTSLSFLQAHELSESKIALVFSDHLAVLTSHGTKVLATSRYRFKKAHFSTSNHGTSITLVEETPSGPVWRQIVHNASVDAADDSNLAIMNRFDYQEESSKVVKLMRDVQHSEWGLQGKRQPEDVTDTFHLNSKRRRRVGTLRNDTGQYTAVLDK